MERRQYLAASGSIGSTLLAGCSDAIARTNERAAGSEYTVTMAPVGEVAFDEVPERWFPWTGDYADMGVALGQADGLQAVGIRDRFPSYYYDELPGVSIDRSELTQLWQDGTGKEVFYELDADVHLIDPNFMINRIQWSEADVEEIEEGVAPFVGNTIFSGSYPWHEDYEYYSLYEAFEKVAEVFQERERFEALREIHESVVADVGSRLPEERPAVAVVYPREETPETFLPYVIDDGTGFKQYRELGVRDALAESDVQDFHETRGEIDYETLLEVDPEVIAIRRPGQYSPREFENGLVAHMRDHDVASELQAVRNDRVIQGGAPYQGPIVYLFQLEMVAQALYPEVFTDDLFDRQAVADVVTGAF